MEHKLGPPACGDEGRRAALVNALEHVHHHPLGVNIGLGVPHGGPIASQPYFGGRVKRSSPDNGSATRVFAPGTLWTNAAAALDTIDALGEEPDANLLRGGATWLCSWPDAGHLL